MLQFTVKLNLISGQFGGLLASKTAKQKFYQNNFTQFSVFMLL